MMQAVATTSKTTLICAVLQKGKVAESAAIIHVHHLAVQNLIALLSALFVDMVRILDAGKRQQTGS